MKAIPELGTPSPPVSRHARPPSSSPARRILAAAAVVLTLAFGIAAMPLLGLLLESLKVVHLAMHRSGDRARGPVRHPHRARSPRGPRPGRHPVSHSVSQPDSWLLAPDSTQPGPRDFTPRRTNVTIREIHQPRRCNISRADMILHICTVILGVTLLIAIFWPGGVH